MSWRRGQVLSQDLRDRVLAAQGSAAAVAERFGVSPSYVLKVRALRARAQLSAGAQCNHVPRKLEALEPKLVEHVGAAGRQQTIDEVRTWLEDECGVRVAHATVHKALVRLGLTRKK